MKPGGPSLHQVSGPGWKILGELELAVGIDSGQGVNQWLAALLDSLELQTAFVNKVLQSAHEATERAMQVESVIQYKHVHVLVFVPALRELAGQSWGFFRLEKIEAQTQDKSTPEHRIELYLYFEETG